MLTNRYFIQASLMYACLLAFYRCVQLKLTDRRYLINARWMEL